MTQKLWLHSYLTCHDQQPDSKIYCIDSDWEMLRFGIDYKELSKNKRTFFRKKRTDVDLRYLLVYETIKTSQKHDVANALIALFDVYAGRQTQYKSRRWERNPGKKNANPLSGLWWHTASFSEDAEISRYFQLIPVPVELSLFACTPGCRSPSH